VRVVCVIPIKQDTTLPSFTRECCVSLMGDSLFAVVYFTTLLVSKLYSAEVPTIGHHHLRYHRGQH
jgi:hypothetical protein